MFKARPSISGQLDGQTGRRFYGALRGPSPAERPPLVELFANGRLIASGLAQSASDRDGDRWVFELLVDSLPPSEYPLSIRGYSPDADASLNGEVVFESRQEAMERGDFLTGRITGYANGAVTGAVDFPGVAADPALVAAYLDEEELARVEVRPPESGGEQHFSLPLPEDVLSDRSQRIDVRFPRGDSSLDGAPFTLTIKLDTGRTDVVGKLNMMGDRVDELSRRVEDIGAAIGFRDQSEYRDELFEYVNALLSIYRDRFERDLDQLRAQVAAATGEAPPINFATGHLPQEIMAQDPGFTGSGWHGVEFDGDTAFRWMRERANLLLPLLLESDATLTVRGFSALQPSMVDDLTLRIDGRRLDHRIDRITETGRWAARAELSPELLDPSPLHTLALETSFARAPNENDRRRISLAIEAVVVE